MPCQDARSCSLTKVADDQGQETEEGTWHDGVTCVDAGLLGWRGSSGGAGDCLAGCSSGDRHGGGALQSAGAVDTVGSA